MPGVDNKLLAVDNDRPDGAPLDVRVEDFGVRDLEAGDKDEAAGDPPIPPNPFMRPL